jgi:hypothetical protein
MAFDVEVSTIDSFQGREADAVVISMVSLFSYTSAFLLMDHLLKGFHPSFVLGSIKLHGRSRIPCR